MRLSSFRVDSAEPARAATNANANTGVMPTSSTLRLRARRRRHRQLVSARHSIFLCLFAHRFYMLAAPVSKQVPKIAIPARSSSSSNQPAPSAASAQTDGEDHSGFGGGLEAHARSAGPRSPRAERVVVVNAPSPRAIRKEPEATVQLLTPAQVAIGFYPLAQWCSHSDRSPPRLMTCAQPSPSSRRAFSR